MVEVEPESRGLWREEFSMAVLRIGVVWLVEGVDRRWGWEKREN